MALTPDEFLKTLDGHYQEEVVADAVNQDEDSCLVLSGLAKSRGEGRLSLSFSPGVQGERWFRIPLDIVREAEVLGDISNKGQNLKFVLILLKPPATEESRILTDTLLRLSEFIEDLTESYRIGVEAAPKAASGPASSATSSSFSGFSPPRISLPPIMIPPIVPKQIDRLSRFSSCAKCKMYVEAALVGLVAAAFAAAGSSGPGAISALKLALEAKWGAAAAEAALNAAFSFHHQEAAKIICRVHGKC